MIEILEDVYCNGILGDGQGIPQTIGDMVHYLYLGIKIVVPILLVIFAMLDLGRAITAKKEEDIKKAFEFAKEHTDAPTILEFMIDSDELVLPMVQGGQALDCMILDC